MCNEYTEVARLLLSVSVCNILTHALIEVRGHLSI